MKNKIANKTIYVLTEGQTEQSYFGRIKEIINSNEEKKYFVTVDIREIEDGSKQDPKGLVEEGRKIKKEYGYDEVWVVFDKERNNDALNKIALDNATKAKIKVAFSSVCFEHWVLLHFERNNYAFVRSDCGSRGGNCVCNGAICLKTYLINQGYFTTYQKGYSKIFDDLRDKTPTAIRNAAWLRMNYTPYHSFHLLNPYTDVDIFLCELFNIKPIKFSRVNLPFTVDQIQYTITSITRITNNVQITFNIINQRLNQVVVNNNNNILIYNNLNIEYAYATQTNIIKPGDSLNNAILNFTIPESAEGLVLKIFENNLEYLIEI